LMTSSLFPSRFLPNFAGNTFHGFPVSPFTAWPLSR